MYRYLWTVLSVQTIYIYINTITYDAHNILCCGSAVFIRRLILNASNIISYRSVSTNNNTRDCKRVLIEFVKRKTICETEQFIKIYLNIYIGKIKIFIYSIRIYRYNVSWKYFSMRIKYLLRHIAFTFLILSLILFIL